MALAKSWVRFWLTPILENLKLGCISSKSSSDTYIYTDTIDIDNIPDTLTNAQVDLHNAVGCAIRVDLHVAFSAGYFGSF
jgi:hypothetical protein